MSRNPSILIVVLMYAILFNGCALHEKHIKADPATRAVKPKVNSTAAAPAPLIQTGRYSAIAATPTKAQSNPLRVMITVTIPREVFTVRQAIKYLLRRSGYRLTEPNPQVAEVADLFNLPLPQVHRQLGPIPLDAALSTLAGPAFELRADPLHRTVGYALTESYREPAIRAEVAHE